MAGEIIVVPFFGQGHLFPCVELCKHLAATKFKATLIIPSHIASSIAKSVLENPKIEILEIENGGGQPGLPPHPPRAGSDQKHMSPFHESERKMEVGLESLLKERFERLPRPACAVIDNMMSWSIELFWKFEIPTVVFFTSGACNAAVEYCSWKTGVGESEFKPGETRLLPGLPEEMTLTSSDLHRPGPPRGGPPSDEPPPFETTPLGGPGFGGGPTPFGAGLDFEGGPPGGPPGLGGGPPRGPLGLGGGPPGGGGKLGRPPWVGEMEGSVGMMLNTCDELEHPFLEYLSKQFEIPVWGVGPLLPEDYWKSSGALVRDGKLRANRKSNYTEDEVVEWLDSQERASVLYVSFGSEVGPSNEEYAQLAEALGESNRPFLWAIQLNSGRHGPPPHLMGAMTGNAQELQGYFPHELVSKVGKRGLIIKGWAPQLMILSHPSIGGFLSHCGWNSTVEAIGRGIPFLAWPIRGDQFNNAKLVVFLLKMGYMVSEDFSKTVKKEEIAKGIELLMRDEEMKKRADEVANKFGNGFPASSVAALDAFKDFISSTK